MKKFWLVFAQEYKKHVLRRRFLFAILSMPLVVGVIILVGFLSVWIQYNSSPVGYVDAFNILHDPQPVPAKKSPFLPTISFIPYTSESAADADLKAKKIQAYYVFSQDYMSTGKVTQFKNKDAGSNINDDFGSFISYNLLTGQSQTVINRLTKGPNLIIRSADGSREFSSNNWLSIVLPFFAGVLFIIAVNVSGGYLLQAVVEEKENRTMEIILTSVSPNQFMAGKVLADLLVGLTELILWIVFGLVALHFVPQFTNVNEGTSVDTSTLLLMVSTLLPAFVMIAAAMGAIGATATEVREAQQVAGLFTLPIVVPFWFVTAIMYNPNGAIAVGLSMFPLTAPISLPLRAVFTDIPTWQTVLTLSLLVLLAIFAVWLAGRIFRLGMLRYGKRVSLSEVFRKQTASLGN